MLGFAYSYDNEAEEDRVLCDLAFRGFGYIELKALHRYAQAVRQFPLGWEKVRRILRPLDRQSLRFATQAVTVAGLLSLELPDDLQDVAGGSSATSDAMCEAVTLEDGLMIP